MRLPRLNRTILLAVAIYIALLILLVWAEHGAEGASIGHIGDAFWYSIVTLTTVGYGDKFPITVAGKAVGLFFLLGSLGALGLLVSTITESFAERQERKIMGHNGTSMTDHVVMIGWDGFGRSIVRQLVNADRHVAIITADRDEVELIHQQFPSDQIFVLFADLDHVASYRMANIEQASVVYMNSDDDSAKLIRLMNMKREFGALNYLVTLDNTDLKETFQAAGVTYALSKNEIASKMIANYIFEPDVAAFTNDLMSSTSEAGHYDIQQYRVVAANPYRSRTFGDAFWELKQSYGTVLLGLSKRQSNGTYLLNKLPSDDMLVEEGDYMIVITDGVGEKRLKTLFGTREGA